MIRGFIQRPDSSHDRSALSNWLGRDGLEVRGELADFVQLASPPANLVAMSANRGYEHQVVIVADVRLDYRQETIEALGFSAEESRSSSDTAVIVAAWRKWGRDCPNYLHGDFAFAVWDEKEQELFLARDRQGMKPLYVLEHSGLIAFSTRIHDLRIVPGCPVHPDPMGLALGLEMNFLDKAFTAYREITRLPPATWTAIGREKRRQQSYWRLDPERDVKLGSDKEYSDHLRALFVEAVRARLETPDRVGVALSGGLDSSSICGVAARLLRDSGRDPLIAFSGMLSRDSAFSEEKYIRAVVEDSGCEFQPFELEGLSPTSGLSRHIAAVGSPFLAGNLFIPDEAYRMAARADVKVYMEGYDGDNAIGHGVALFQDLARRGHWLRLYRELSAFHRNGGVFGHSTLNWTPLSTVRQYIWHTRLKNWKTVQFGMRGIAKAGRMTRRGPAPTPQAQEIHPPFLRHIRREMWDRKQKSLGDLKPHENTRHAHIAIISSGKHPWLMEMMSALAQSHGVEIRLPFYDTRLIEFCAAIPEDQKLRSGLVRWVMRNAMEGYLPDLVRLRPEKSNYEVNFVDTFRREEMGRLKRLLIEQDLGLGELLDMDQVAKLISRLEEGKLMGEGLSALYHIFSVALWIDEGWADSNVATHGPSINQG